VYELLKKITPTAFIKKNETAIRVLLSQFYKGHRFVCSVCEFKMARFITSKKGDKLCPKCGSLARTRRLWQFLKPKAKDVKILHFSPSRKYKENIRMLEKHHLYYHRLY
jgi:hypothetical protein